MKSPHQIAQDIVDAWPYAKNVRTADRAVLVSLIAEALENQAWQKPEHYIPKFLASLPEQSARDAAVLRAAKKLVDTFNRRNNTYMEGTCQLITPEIDAISELVEAVNINKK